ncbi:MAG: FAD-dependent thymidylate synthase [Rickettsiales bacterium]|nr:FAD-dependent thymidylate synthase [Pseudomonadota bacterium]MDA0965664.1 FAD-dependent thymidylate synthase [Pseudomonadota bacterium]MDG4542988.1 FAD-dependent thymidylate synthase [Rickettsiales bacterium]MDG4544564.1 FAD-dependent thymidylate synthase [Rickettsiales bacterium]MDG4546686.1 FAD-dependent thymidylate synthase [Rickettsiales bacterium]
MAITELQRAEVAAQKTEVNKTLRKTVDDLEAILYEPIPVLDHGFVRVVDYMGDDSAIVQAARVSYGKGTKQVSLDAGLINYLLRHRHTTPFEMCEIKFHLKMPIFVARQWIRHRTANVNEYSARYSVLDNEFYIPSAEQLAAQSTKNHQGRGEESLSQEEANRVIEILKGDSQQCYKHYEELMNCNADGEIIDHDKKGIARELARMNLPINIYTQWYWKIDLHNLMHFLALRADSHAQYEIRVFAQTMLDIVKRWVPITYNAFMDHRVNSTEISGKGMEVIKAMINRDFTDQESSGMSKREWSELMEKLGQNL